MAHCSVMTLSTRLLAGALALLPLSSLANSEYQQWLQQTRKEYQAYLDANDKAFLGFLQQQWEVVDISAPEQRDNTPKPVDLPQAPEPEPVIEDDTPLVTLPPVLPEAPNKPTPRPKDADTDSDTTATPSAPKNQRKAQLDFFGDRITIHYPKTFRQQRFFRRVSSDGIAKAWQTLAETPHQALVSELQQTVQQLQLNDWGAALLFDQFVRSLNISEHSRVLTSWFLLVKAGYDARVAYDDKQVYLLIATSEQLYGVTFFTLNGKRYYSVNLNGDNLTASSVYTYDGQHDLGKAPIRFDQPNRFVAGGNTERRTLEFNYDGHPWSVQLDLPQGYVGYYAQYPQLALASYFRAGVPTAIGQQLLQQLQPLVKDQTELEAANRLIRFVQTAFAYETDEQQFQQENYLFAAETLYYPYSDCEDRAILYSWLVNELLGLDTVIMSFPGHVATAINFRGHVEGTGWQQNGKRYVIADPTFVNANVGMVMPQYSKLTPTLTGF
ncbi:hypothetical protein [Oceanobacter kriegii]|uniref:hypothetical protein n=1 Tax=Oceanobacter kriegii TaxID=64972 RepID=UPI0004016EAC|nr:hypothetical protein [Oceanobacter kriegii]